MKKSMCSTPQIACPVRHLAKQFYMPWDKMYMPRACGHTSMLSHIDEMRKGRIDM